MIEEMAKVQAEILARFDCVNDWFADPDLGFKALPISGRFIRTVDLDTFIARVKSMLPGDAKLMINDGAVMRMSMPNDTYIMAFGSRTWPRVAEGQMLPRLEPLFLGAPVGAPIPDLRTIYVPEGIECRVLINKHTHTLSVPRGEETDDQCVVVVTPK